MNTTEHRRTRVPGLIDTRAIGMPLLAGKVLHLTTRTGMWQDAGKTVPAVADTDPIYTWEDISGNGNDLVQATAANRPLLQTDVVGTIDAAEFDGANDWMEIAAALFGHLTATVFLVVYLSSNSEKGAMFGVGNNTNGWKIGVGSISFDGLGNNLIILFDNVKWLPTGDPIGTGVHLLTVRLTAGVPEWWIDGALEGSTTGTPIAPAALTSLGRDGAATRYYTDHLVEVIASTSSVSAAELAAMNAYLMGLYGI